MIIANRRSLIDGPNALERLRFWNDPVAIRVYYMRLCRGCAAGPRSQLGAAHDGEK